MAHERRQGSVGCVAIFKPLESMNKSAALSAGEGLFLGRRLNLP